MFVPLHAGNPGAMTGSGNWTYFVPGRHPLLIDAGVGVATHLEAIAEARDAGPQRVLVTHAHGDHINGVSAIAARWPATRFAKMAWPDRDAAHPVRFAPLAHGDIVAAGDDDLRAVHTPGHAPDHLCFWHQPSRTLFSGDLLVVGSTVVIPATLGGSLREYLQSLQTVLDLDPVRLLPAHGPPITDPAALIHQYVAHRLAREQQILAALDAGLRSIEAIVGRIYVGLNEPLVPMARESVRAHLIKLEEENVVVPVNEEWVRMSV